MGPDTWQCPPFVCGGSENKDRAVRLYQVAPIFINLILCLIGEHVLGMPRSY